jgi:hypothetical protein
MHRFVDRREQPEPLSIHFCWYGGSRLAAAYETAKSAASVLAASCQKSE